VFILQWRIIYEDWGGWREIFITIEEIAVDVALQRFLRELDALNKPIRLSELLCVEKKEITDTVGLTK